MGVWTQADARKALCDNGAREWSGEAASQRMPRTGGNHEKLGESHEKPSSSEPAVGTNPADTLISAFWL